MQNRCQTYNQRIFNYENGGVDDEVVQLLKTHPFISEKIIEHAKPGTPLSIIRQYVAHCIPNFAIHEGAEITLVHMLFEQLIQEERITTQQYTELKMLKIETVHRFLEQVKNYMTPEDYSILVEYLNRLALTGLNAFLSELPHGKTCGQVYYKPNNPQFAQQGAVSSSTRLLKLNVDTISTAAAKHKRLNQSNVHESSNTSFIYKDKTPSCSRATYHGNPFFFQGQIQKKNICNSHVSSS